MILTPLAPVDYVFTGNRSCPVTFAFAYSEQLDPQRLQQSLDRLIEHIPALGGRLRALRRNTYAYEVPERPRLRLEVASGTRSFDELGNEAPVQLVETADDRPLMTARLTQTPSGSILAVSMSHALVDGFSFFLAMSKWAACMRGETIESPPVERLLRPSEAQVIAAARALTPRSVLERSGLFWSSRRDEGTELPVQDRIFLSAGAIADLLERAQADVDTKLRQNDVLTAWLWRKFGRRWWADQDNPTVYMSCPVDMRRSLGAANKALFGCTICYATARASYDELTRAPLGELALRVQRSVTAVFAGGFDRRVAPLEALRRRHGAAALESVHMRHPQHGMLVTNLSRLPLAELDFGSGAPVDLKLYVEVGAMAAVLPARDGATLSVYRPAATPADQIAKRRPAARAS